MPCVYCNSNKSPNSDGTCPDCGRVVTQSETAAQPSSEPPAVNVEQQYPIQHWRCTWMILLSKMISAALIAGVLAGCVWSLYHFVDNEVLNNWKRIIWICVFAIPSIYFLFEALFFSYNRFIKKYELRPKELLLIKGIFNMKTSSTLLESLWGMKLRQNVLQRMLGTGRITLFSDDVTTPVFHINDIGRVRSRFDELVRYQNYALDCSNVKVERDDVKDTSTQVWRYSWLDLIDETIWGVVITIGLIVLGYYIPWGNAYLRYALLLIIPALYWIWLIWTFIDKICCTKYTLYNATLVKESGLFSKKINVYVLCHIQDCEMSQNLWQRIVGDVGNITLFLKWENKDAEAQNGGPLSTTKKDVLHGLSNHKEKRDTLKERMLRERHRRQAGS